MSSDETFDPFAPGGKDPYDPCEFYTRSTDARGHSRMFRWGHGSGESVHLPPYVMGAIQELKERWAPYRTNANIVQDAMIHLIHMRAEQDLHPSPRAVSTYEQAIACAEVERLIERKQKHEEILQRVELLLSSSTSAEELSDAVEVVQNLALTLTLPSYITKVNDLLNRYSWKHS